MLKKMMEEKQTRVNSDTLLKALENLPEINLKQLEIEIEEDFKPEKAIQELRSVFDTYKLTSIDNDYLSVMEHLLLVPGTLEI